LSTSDKTGEDYSIQERMRLSLNDSARFFRGITTVVVICIFVTAFFFTNSYLLQDYISQYGTLGNLPNCEGDDGIAYTDPEGNCKIFFPSSDIKNYDKILGVVFGFQEYNLVAVYIIGVFLAGSGIWILFKGRNIVKEIKAIKINYLSQSYYFVLETSLHENKNIPETFLKIATEIFPEIKAIKIKAEKKSKTEWYKKDTEIGDMLVDAKVETKEGQFIVKFFDHDVDYKEIKQAVKVIKKHVSKNDLFRFVILVRSFGEFDSDQMDQKFSPEWFEHDVLIEDMPIDLIRVNENNFEFITLSV